MFDTYEWFWTQLDLLELHNLEKLNYYRLFCSDKNCCDHEDQEHRPYFWDPILLYVQTLNTTLWQTQGQDSNHFMYFYINLISSGTISDEVKLCPVSIHRKAEEMIKIIIL